MKKKSARVSKPVTLAALNAEMKAEGIDATLHKGAGYFYFVGGQDYPSIYVYSLKQMNFNDWMAHIRDAVHNGGRGWRENPKRRGRGLPVTASDKNVARSLSDKELSFMIRNTSGAAKNLFTKEAGRRVAEEMKSGTRRNPAKKRAKRNPPMYGARSRRTAEANLIGLQVYEIRYRHATDGKDYKHVMESMDVLMLGMPDGTVKLESATGLPLWEEINV